MDHGKTKKPRTRLRIRTCESDELWSSTFRKSRFTILNMLFISLLTITFYCWSNIGWLFRPNKFRRDFWSAAGRFLLSSRNFKIPIGSRNCMNLIGPPNKVVAIGKNHNTFRKKSFWMSFSLFSWQEGISQYAIFLFVLVV